LAEELGAALRSEVAQLKEAIATAIAEEKRLARELDSVRQEVIAWRDAKTKAASAERPELANEAEQQERAASARAQREEGELTLQRELVELLKKLTHQANEAVDSVGWLERLTRQIEIAKIAAANARNARETRSETALARDQTVDAAKKALEELTTILRDSQS
jgi:hypothetical protein